MKKWQMVLTEMNNIYLGKDSCEIKILIQKRNCLLLREQGFFFPFFFKDEGVLVSFKNKYVTISVDSGRSFKPE